MEAGSIEGAQRKLPKILGGFAPRSEISVFGVLSLGILGFGSSCGYFDCRATATASLGSMRDPG